MAKKSKQRKPKKECCVSKSRCQRCPIRIKLLPGGEVLSAEVQSNCPYSAENQRTVEAAVKKASPLPLDKDGRLPIRDFTVNFYPSR